MFSYFGSKSKIANYYPPPKYGKIIEPFAGSARYSLKWFDREVILVDKYDVIINIWKWLQKCSTEDIRRLPDLKAGDNIRNFSFDCEEAKNLMGFMICGGGARPQWKASLQGFGGEVSVAKKKVINSLHKIKHWKIICGEYTELENIEATWFIDPPYQFGGHKYFHNNIDIDYEKLAIWCKERIGQTIVCENTKATWLPFKPMKKIQGADQTNLTEAIWSNHKTSFDSIQIQMPL